MKQEQKDQLKKMGIKKKDLVTQKGVFAKAREGFGKLNHDRKMQGFTQVWQGLPGMPGPGLLYKQAWDDLKTIEEAIKSKGEVSLKDELKRLIKMYPKRFAGLNREQKKQNLEFRDLINKLVEETELHVNKAGCRKAIALIKKDLDESEKREREKLMRMLGIQTTTQALRLKTKEEGEE